MRQTVEAVLFFSAALLSAGYALTGTLNVPNSIRPVQLARLDGGAANAVAARVGEGFLVLTRVLLVKRKDGKQETKNAARCSISSTTRRFETAWKSYAASPI